MAAYEQDGENWNRQRYYVHGSTYIDERAVLHDDAGDRDYYYLLDDLYTAAGLADEVGNVFESYDHDGYGTPTMTAHTFSDFDGDGDVDPNDFLTFSNCYNGPLNPPKPGCANPMADLDRDGDVDGNDFLTFSNCQNGANNPPNCSPSDFAVGSSPVGNVYFFTGRRLDAFDFDAGGGGESAMGGGGLFGETETLSSADTSFWLCFYSSVGGPENPLDFDGDGTIDENDLTWLDKCISDAGGSTEGATESAQTESTLTEGGTTASASASSTAGLVLYHYRARAHDPGLGRFMQRDPLGYPDGMNLYQYVRSRPSILTDPLGLDVFLPLAPITPVASPQPVTLWCQVKNVGGKCFSCCGTLIGSAFVVLCNPTPCGTDDIIQPQPQCLTTQQCWNLFYWCIELRASENCWNAWRNCMNNGKWNYDKWPLPPIADPNTPPPGYD